MISKNNPLLAGASGKLQDIVVKQYKDKIVITAVPDMSNRKLSPKQKEANHKMQIAIRAAKALTANPVQKQRACDILQVAPNEVFRAIVKHYLLNEGRELFKETEQETQDKQVLVNLKRIILNEVPDAELQLFGNRAKGSFNSQSDWDILILTNDDYSKSLKWELQERLFNATIQQGTRVNILLAQKAKWYSSQEYEVIRKRIEGELVPVK
jgi:predicted nucleotidyltransferase